MSSKARAHMIIYPQILSNINLPSFWGDKILVTGVGIASVNE